MRRTRERKAARPAVEIGSRDWFGKASAALVLGFTLALGLTSIFGWYFQDAGNPLFSAQGQMAMWLMAPIWAGILSFCFLFGSGPRAWAWLGAANLLAWGAYLICRLAA